MIQVNSSVSFGFLVGFLNLEALILYFREIFLTYFIGDFITSTFFFPTLWNIHFNAIVTSHILFDWAINT